MLSRGAIERDTQIGAHLNPHILRALDVRPQAPQENVRSTVSFPNLEEVLHLCPAPNREHVAKLQVEAGSLRRGLRTGA